MYVINHVISVMPIRIRERCQFNRKIHCHRVLAFFSANDMMNKPWTEENGIYAMMVNEV